MTTPDNSTPVTIADLAELESRLRNDALAAVDRHMDSLETKLRKSLADTLQGHTQLLELLRDGVQEIRSFMEAASVARSRAPHAVVELASSSSRRTRADTRGDRARAALYAVYELPVERMPNDEASKAQLDVDVRKLEAFTAGMLGAEGSDDGELEAAIGRVAALVRPPRSPEAQQRWQRFIPAGGKSARKYG
jgi:hypothetical protein